ncbi:MAG TPA: 4'-phosphopantetheinyl transferase superfamily protein [Dokdonella sp.]|nr:4'-phosphopantetheinyl transferase superfamily protein [Dokdonella sp.]
MRSNNADRCRPVSAPPPLTGDEIHVWVQDTGQPGPRAVRDAARALLGRLLLGYAGTAAVPAIEAGEHGKPFVPSLPWLDFNLSHAGSLVAIAFARDQAIGIDIEPLDRRVSTDGIAARFFGPREAAALGRTGAHLRQVAFLRLWTHKEAVLKALGDGLGFGLHRIEFELSREGHVERLLDVAAEAGRPAEWQLHAFDPAVGVVGCLAWRGEPRAVQRLQLVS